MTQFQLYLTGVTISMVICILVVAYLRRPLYHILTDLCGTDERARFWAQITHLSFFLISMLMALTYSGYPGQTDYNYLGSHVGRTLLGLVIVTGFLSLTISLFAAKDKPTLPA